MPARAQMQSDLLEYANQILKQPIHKTVKLTAIKLSFNDPFKDYKYQYHTSFYHQDISGDP